MCVVTLTCDRVPDLFSSLWCVQVPSLTVRLHVDQTLCNNLHFTSVIPPPPLLLLFKCSHSLILCDLIRRITVVLFTNLFLLMFVCCITCLQLKIIFIFSAVTRWNWRFLCDCCDSVTSTFSWSFHMLQHESFTLNQTRAARFFFVVHCKLGARSTHLYCSFSSQQDSF